MARPKRTAQQPDLPHAIKATAWRHIADFGAPALSLRAIARALRITAPAIYNYYPRRDDLVTALTIDAYTSFGDSQLAARDSIPAADLVGRFLAIGMAYRTWALSHPQHYQLMFEAPIPGYEAPKEQILPAAARSISALVSVVEAFRVADRLRGEAPPPVAPCHAATFALWHTHGGAADPLSLSIAVVIWGRVHGLVSLEIAGHLPPFGPNDDAMYRYELAAIAQQFFKE